MRVPAGVRFDVGDQLPFGFCDRELGDFLQLGVERRSSFADGVLSLLYLLLARGECPFLTTYAIESLLEALFPLTDLPLVALNLAPLIAGFAIQRLAFGEQQVLCLNEGFMFFLVGLSYRVLENSFCFLLRRGKLESSI